MDNKQIGQRLKSVRESLGRTLDDVASDIGVARSTILRYENGTILKIKLPVIEAISRSLNVNPDWVIGKSSDRRIQSQHPANFEAMPGRKTVPIIGTIACGYPITAEQNFDGSIDVPDWISCDFVLRCQGDSMINARIHDGDIVCIRYQQTADNGQIVAVLIDGEFETEATLKRLHLVDGGVVLMAENPAYPPQVFLGEDASRVHIIGIATHFISTIT